MKKYYVIVEVTNTNGSQQLSCMAKSKQEAFEKFKSGDVEIEAEELEVMGTSDICFNSITNKP